MPYVYVNDPVNDYDLNGQWGIDLGGIFKNAVKTVTRAVTKVSVAVVKTVVKVATTVANTVSYVARKVVAPVVSRVVGTVTSVAKSAWNVVTNVGTWVGQNSDLISFSASVAGIVGCVAVAAACVGIGLAVTAISGATAALASYNKNRDIGRAFAQGVGAAVMDRIGIGVTGKIASSFETIRSTGRIGTAAVDLNGAPILFGAGMGAEVGIDWAYDQAN